MRRQLAVALALLPIAAIISGCQLSRDSPPQLDRWGGPLSELRVQWTSAPGIDLTTEVAVPVRAYVESRWLAQWQGNLDYGYPGFLDATPANADGLPFGSDSRRPEADNQVPDPFFGNEVFHFLSIERTGRQVTATVCTYSYAVAKRTDDGSYFSVARSQSVEPRGISASRVLLLAPVDGKQIIPPQEGPEASPSQNVFGGWVVEAFQSSLSKQQPGFDSAWPTYEPDTAACVSAAPDSAERRTFLTQGDHPRSDFPTAPPSPGWPEPST